MELYFKTIIQHVFLIGILLTLVSCEEEVTSPEQTPKEQRIKELTSKPWKLLSATVDGKDITNFYNGFTISFTDKSFKTTNGKGTWPSIGTWEFKDGNINKLIRDDGLIFTISNLSDDQLRITFTWTEIIYDAGRIKAIDGKHVFDLERLV